MANIEVTPEDHSVNFTVSLQNATDRDFHWKLTGEGFSPACVIGEKAEGVEKLNGNKLVIPITLKATNEVKGLKNFRMTIRENGPSGNVVATSSVVNVNIIIVTPPPEKIGIIPIRVPFISDGEPSWSIEQGNYEFTVADTNRIELKESLEDWGYDIGIRWFDKDGVTDNDGGTWGPYYYHDQENPLVYDRTYWNATGDRISSIWKETSADACARYAEEANNSLIKSCVMPFVLMKDKLNENGDVVGQRDFSNLDLVAELTVLGFEEYTQPWINDPVYAHRAYSGPQGNTMIDCPIYKNVTPVPGQPLTKDHRSSVPTVQDCHIEYFKNEGRGYVQIPLYQIGHYTYDRGTDKFSINQQRNGFNARLCLTIKERTTGEVVSGLVFSVIQQGLLTDDTSFMTDRWAKMDLRGVIGDVIRISEISPLYWEEPQRWVACDYTPEPEPEDSNIRVVAYDHYEQPGSYSETEVNDPITDIEFFNAPEVDEWPLGMSIKSLNLYGAIVGTTMHVKVRPTKLGQPLNPPVDLSNIGVTVWEGPGSYLDTLFHGSIHEQAVNTWKGKRQRPIGNPEWTVEHWGDGILQLTCQVKPTVVDRVHQSTIVLNFNNGYWAALEADVTRLPGYYRVRVNGSVVTDISLD